MGLYISLFSSSCCSNLHCTLSKFSTAMSLHVCPSKVPNAPIGNVGVADLLCFWSCAGGIICWPSTRTLLLLRLWSLIFPPSDFRHAVMTPAMLLMSEYLLRCPVTSARDVAIGSFICSLLLSVMVLSVTSGFFGQKYSLNWATNIFVLPFSVNDIMFLDNVLALDNVLFVDDSFSNPCAYSVCFLLARVNHM